MMATLSTDDAAAWIAAHDRFEAAYNLVTASHVALMGYLPVVDPGPVRLFVLRAVDDAVTATAHEWMRAKGVTR